MSYDVVIVGSGIAGLSLALKLNTAFPNRKICVVTKGDELDSNTRYAQGGIAVVADQQNDSYEKHIEDTLKAGDGLCDKRVVEKVIRQSASALHELIKNGVDFDPDDQANFILRTEGGHSNPRIVHRKDMTGFEIAISLLIQVKTIPEISLFAHHMVIDLILGKQGPNANEVSCKGVYVLDSKNSVVKQFDSRITVLATGGMGQLYKSTTNPKVATGDGIAIAHRAGASIRNMKFIQFHPTVLREGTHASNFLITEALRGYGAFLRNSNGERFLFKYDSRGELACRDVVSRAIENEIRYGTEGCVYLDCTHLSPEALIKDFPNVYSYCLEKGIDITKERVPVCPAAHYLCGGIEVDSSARTSIVNLYALGECSSTGLHGANRLASNSLLEAIAYAEFCFIAIKNSIDSIDLDPSEFKTDHSLLASDNKSLGLDILRERLQILMTKHVGIIRTTRRLKFAYSYLCIIESQLNKYYSDFISEQLLELRNMVTIAKLVVEQSLHRKENRGTFYNRDLDVMTAHSSLEKIYS